MIHSRTRISFIFIFLIVLSVMVYAGELKLGNSAFGGFKARMIGPAVMSGRITDIDANNQDTRIIYVATAGGGLWKSLNGGTTFRQIFRDYTMGVECVTVDQKNPETVWVGTGECNVRNSVSIGTGLYRSTNGGKSWTFMGFKDSERISQVVVHPRDSKTVYVAVMGHLWNANNERGVYKTTDNGKTWNRILFVDENTGCADLDIDPKNPEILYAAMWQFRRKPYIFSSGGKGSGLFKTTDGGKTWKKLSRGIPKGNLGRIAIAVAPSKPDRVYATIEAKKTSLFRSDNKGETWTKVNDTISVSMRPFYFSHLIVDPKDHQRIYVTGLFVSSSDNGGKSFNFGFFGRYHSDVHALWVNPKDTNQLLIGTDGGVYISQNKGQQFDMVSFLPVSQFYHVYYDMQVPYNVYGGLQDNGSWFGPSKSRGGGIQNKDWRSVGYGDGFHVYPHQTQPHIVYWEWQGGNIARTNQKTNETKDIKPLPTKKGEADYRFNWNAGMALSPSNPDGIYIGAQYLFKSTDRGDTWKRISPDLTTNDPKKQQQHKSGGLTIDDTTAENHCTIFTISESPKDARVIWVGTDDGNLQVTRNGGKSWKNVVKNIKGLPAFTWCSTVEAGHFDAGTAYVTFDGHRTGDMKPYVYKTSDYGKTWKSLITDTLEGYCHVIREDLVNKNLLFLGTEFGLFTSINGGQNWAHLKEALPKVSVRDLALHPREHDLIIATHGLGIQIIDDITPLRHLSAEVLNSEAVVLPSKTAIMELPNIFQEFPPDSEFVGDNPPGGAAITYYLKKRHIFGTLKLEILDASGKVIQTLPTTKRKGLNRLYWGMRLKPPKAAGAPGLSMFVFQGPMVKEGLYTARLVKGKKTFTGKIKLIPDVVSGHSQVDRELRYKTVMELYRMQEELGYIGNSVSELSKKIEKRLEQIRDRKIKKRLTVFRKKIDEFHSSIVQHAGIMAGDKLREKVMALYSSVIQYGGRPTQAQIYYLSVLKDRIKQAEIKFNLIRDKDLPSLNAFLKKKNQEEFKLITREEYSKKE
jgi:photosystem II stability/assembly factor-like uncharacterized protein